MNFIAFAHPHMFISTSEEFVFEGNQLQGFWVEWEFDSFFSAEIDFYYDWDDNNSFNAAETQEIYDNAFINLKNYYFYIFIRQGSTRTNPDRVYNFSARMKGDTLIYRFYVDLSEYVGNDIYIAIYDFSYFCNIQYKTVELDYDDTKVTVSYSIDQNKDYPVYYDPWGPITDNTVYYKWQKGLEIFYPKEIHIQYK